MTQISVGQIAGLIAFAIFIARIWAPSCLVLILSWLLGDRNTATTLTVSAPAFHTSLWPVILRSDSSQTHGVRPVIRLIAGFVTWISLLIAFAGIITPLGLYETLGQTNSVRIKFQYLPDTSPFGIGTPPRSNLSFSRLCGSYGYSPCPFSDTVVIDIVDSDDQFQSNLPYGYNLSVPQFIYDVYSSGTTENTTISNYFDIQWRRYYTSSDPKFNNGSNYLISGFSSMQSLIMNQEVQVVEGLVVDMVNGSVGLRNHTFPPGYQYGATWSEDLLFIEPETVCVNTNLTLDYSIALAPNITTSVVNLVLTDRGGFVHLDKSFPEPDLTNPQANPDLWTRAYKAAWLNNALTALYYNVTDDNNSTTGTRAFSYMNSAINKTFQLPNLDYESQTYYSLATTQLFGNFLDIGGGLENSSDPASSGPPPNPFNVQSDNFSTISTECGTAGGLDFANINAIFVECGFIQGAPQRQDAGTRLVFESGSTWSQPLYTCASAVKATIKTVSFSYNGTDNVLSNLVVTNIQDKKYLDERSMPLWGVENTGDAYHLNDLTLVWGLISEEYANNENVSALRQPSLYLPGFSLDAIMTTIGFDNMPGSEAFLGAMQAPYTVSSTSPGVSGTDYTGINDISMWVRWQDLSKSAEGIQTIPNLIWADTAASAVVGTKGVLGPGNTGSENVMPILITPTVRQVKYHWPYAIPALVVALALLLITIVALFTLITGHNSIVTLREHLQRLSPGRIFTTLLLQEHKSMKMSSKEWARESGNTTIDLSGEYPTVDGVVRKAETTKAPEKKEAESNHDSEEIQEEGDEYAQGYEQVREE
ncbi:hypothetical protein N431DRAFT_377905 [Stipitochalara longipes BDJ]|nr:hypothetical protein N431DRAFT_377905 [Stipitochalara longipes BDJ]